MTARADPAGSVLDRIKQTLVGLRMPRALEMTTPPSVSSSAVSSAARGDRGTLAEELSIRETQRVKAAR